MIYKITGLNRTRYINFVAGNKYFGSFLRNETKYYKFRNIRAFGEDLFTVCYEPNPEAQTSIKVEEQWAKEVMQQLMSAPSFSQLRKTTAYSRHLSGMAVAELVPMIQEIMSDLVGTKKEPDIEDIRKQVRQQKNNNCSWVDETIAEGKEAAKQIQNTTRRIQALGFQLFEKVEKTSERVLERVRKESEKMKGNFKAGKEFVQNPEESYSPAEIKEAYERAKDNRHLAKIYEMCGAMVPIAEEVRRKRCEFTQLWSMGVHTGNDIGALLPEERMLMMDEELFPVFASKYNEESLLQLKLEAKTKQGKGAVVVCLDTSGSMDGENDTWSKALTLCLAKMAEKDKRDFIVLPFNGGPLPYHKFSKSSDWNTAKYNAFLSPYPSGGTSFDRALNRTLYILNNESKFLNADVIFITDGLDEVDSDIQSRMTAVFEKLGTSLFPVYIGDISSPSLDKLAEKSFCLDMSQDNDFLIRELFSRI